jgi:hypothetical protein
MMPMEVRGAAGSPAEGENVLPHLLRRVLEKMAFLSRTLGAFDEEDCKSVTPRRSLSLESLDETIAAEVALGSSVDTSPERRGTQNAQIPQNGAD